ncbi:hypothetical protein [Candidatus Harpocratesius sp.]
MKCKNCNKETTVICHICGEPICSKHAYHMRKYFYCLDCFLKERKKGLVRAWSIIIILGLLAVIIISIYH